MFSFSWMQKCRALGFPQNGNVHQSQEQKLSVIMANKSINVINYRKRPPCTPLLALVVPEQEGFSPWQCWLNFQLDLGIFWCLSLLGVLQLWLRVSDREVWGLPQQGLCPPGFTAELEGLHFLHLHTKICK